MLVVRGAGCARVAGLCVAVGTGVGVVVGAAVGVGVGVGVGLSVGMTRGPTGTIPVSSTGPCGRCVGVGVGSGRVKSCTEFCAASGAEISSKVARAG